MFTRRLIIVPLIHTIKEVFAKLGIYGRFGKGEKRGSVEIIKLPKIPRELEKVSSIDSISEIVLELARKGATMMITEDKKILDEMADCMRREARGELPRTEISDFTSKRDRAIADNIDRTLGEGELGILFVGCARKVEHFLLPPLK